MEARLLTTIAGELAGDGRQVTPARKKCQRLSSSRYSYGFAVRCENNIQGLIEAVAENAGGDVERILKPAVSRLRLIRSQEAPSLTVGLPTRLAQRLVKEIDHWPVVGFFLLASRGGEIVTSQRQILPHFDGAVCEALAEGQS